VVDLCGITDPRVAVLPGGHTAKAIPKDFLAAEQVDTLVLLLPEGQDLARPWTDGSFTHTVEDRAAAECRRLGCEVQKTLPLGRTGRTYVVLRVPAADPANGPQVDRPPPDLDLR
jgi:hypothetical protein